MGNILSAELCEEKIDYPEKLSKQEKGNRVELNVSEFLYNPAGPHIAAQLQRAFAELFIHKSNSACFIPYMKHHGKERRKCMLDV